MQVIKATNQWCVSGENVINQTYREPSSKHQKLLPTKYFEQNFFNGS